MKKLFTIAILVFCLTSCAPVYIPNSVNVPLFNQKGKTSISGFWGSPGVEIQGAYSITNNVFLMGSCNYHGGLDKNTQVYFGEIGAGYFHILEENYIYELSVGGGLGSSKSQYSDYDWWSGNTTTTVANGNYSRFIIQPSIGYNRKNFIIGICYRNSLVNFPEYHESINQHQILYKHQQGYFGEPAFFMRIGNKYLKVSCQAGFSLSYGPNTFYPTNFPFLISTGLNMILGNLEK